MAMKNSPEKYRESLQESFLELLWRQWRALGVASHGPETARPVDLEALVLGTAMAAGQERRLWTAALYWLDRCREWVNGARLKRMADPFIRSDEKLKRPLIQASAWRDACAVLEPTVSARAKGRGDPKADRVITLPRLQKPSLLQLLLRGFFGINARAELVLFLLSWGKGNSNQIARETHYDQKNIYLILERWTESGFVDREKQGRQNLYELNPGLPFIWPEDDPQKFWRWEPFFRSFGRLLVAAAAEPWRADAYLLSSLFRELRGDIAPFAKIAGMSLPEPQLLLGEELFAPMAAALPKIMGRFS